MAVFGEYTIIVGDVMKAISKKFLLIFLLGISLFCFMGCKLEKIKLYICYAETYQGKQEMFVASLIEDKVSIFHCYDQYLKYIDRNMVWGSLVLPAYSSVRIELNEEDITNRLIKMKDSNLAVMKKFISQLKGEELYNINGESFIIENFFSELRQKGETVKLKVIFYS